MGVGYLMVVTYLTGVRMFVVSLICVTSLTIYLTGVISLIWVVAVVSLIWVTVVVSLMGVMMVLSLIGITVTGVLSLMAVKLFVFEVEVFTVNGTVVVLLFVIVDD